MKAVRFSGDQPCLHARLSGLARGINGRNPEGCGARRNPFPKRMLSSFGKDPKRVDPYWLDDQGVGRRG
jgi:hypothetical protein